MAKRSAQTEPQDAAEQAPVAAAPPEAPPADRAAAAPPQRELVELTRLGAGPNWRLSWRYAGHQGAITNHVSPDRLRAKIRTHGEIPQLVQGAARQHRQRIVDEAQWMLDQFPSTRWDADRIRAFAERAGIALPESDASVAQLLHALYR